MAGYRTWDIVVVPFPFTDSPQAQPSTVRPAVIVSTDVLSRRNGKYVLAMVTSAGNTAHFGDVAIKDLNTAGLPAASVVRPSKLAVVEPGDLHKRVGTLAHADRVRVSKQLREYLAVESSRVRGCPLSPLTPPYVRFRIRRFKQNAGDAGGLPPARPARVA